MFFVWILTLFVMTPSLSFSLPLETCGDFLLDVKSVSWRTSMFYVSSWKTCRKIEHKCQSYRDSICSSSCIICWSSEEEMKRAWRVSQLTLCASFRLLAYHFFFSSWTLSVIFSPLILPFIFMQNRDHETSLVCLEWNTLFSTGRKLEWFLAFDSQEFFDGERISCCYPFLWSDVLSPPFSLFSALFHVSKGGLKERQEEE